VDGKLTLDLYVHIAWRAVIGEKESLLEKPELTIIPWSSSIIIIIIRVRG